MTAAGFVLYQKFGLISLKFSSTLFKGFRVWQSP
nr:MAG TPA: hypothetical protein [Caudoviricetes sp.]